MGQNKLKYLTGATVYSIRTGRLAHRPSYQLKYTPHKHMHYGLLQWTFDHHISHEFRISLWSSTYHHTQPDSGWLAWKLAKAVPQLLKGTRPGAMPSDSKYLTITTQPQWNTKKKSTFTFPGNLFFIFNKTSRDWNQVTWSFFPPLGTLFYSCIHSPHRCNWPFFKDKYQRPLSARLAKICYKSP